MPEYFKGKSKVGFSYSQTLNNYYLMYTEGIKKTQQTLWVIVSIQYDANLSANDIYP